MGFSSVELLFDDRHTLLEIRKEAREKDDGKHAESLLEYATQLKSGLGKLRALAQENLEKSQQKHKCLYDKGKKWRAFDVGEWVLVLVPSSANKLKSE
ncbi:hypothetical protein NDU88_002022 [Pleurodeles waltl]|uniref:Uncharacterized protein n=1 Tax=Pleurodeles waltl TaxID=8319 RepID=A0AAV7WPG2_PLEWA|nr:hypothetical protein NDU88_002022 [Pleurodeles waltl]